MKRPILLVVITLTAILELIVLYTISTSYEHTIAYTFYIPFYVFIIFITINAFYLKRIVFRKICIISILLLVILPAILFITKPSFTYHEAQELIKKSENVKIVEDDYRTFESGKGKLYRITAKRDNAEVIFVFSPTSGEYEEVK